MEMRVPGDKSVSQRALILSALARGESRIRGLLPQGDPASTAGALRELGVSVPPLPADGAELRITGLGLRELRPPPNPLDLQNSGTGARLLLGVLAGQPMEAVVTGDESLRSRPMSRVTNPLSSMGASFQALEAEGRLPMRVRGGRLRSFSYTLPVASAQVKSALLLAGLVGGVEVRLREPGRSRDHTERMLRALGVGVASGPLDDGWEVSLSQPPAVLPSLDLDVPGDFSSAAFFILLGLLSQGGEHLLIRGVGLNPTRTGLLQVLARMGARIRTEDAGEGSSGEPVGTLVVEPSDLKACQVGEGEIPGLIDEVPILAMGAARAQGVTRISGARELRVKETDRIKALVRNLEAVGVEVEELEDGLAIQGTDRPLSGTVRSFGDHRIAMAFGVLGALPGNKITVDEPRVAGVSFPGFWEMLAQVKRGRERAGRGVDPGDSAGTRRPGRRPPVVTLDGPAGSGKSSTAREVARRLGFRHLDSGALYRALTFALLSEGIPEEEWPGLTARTLARFPIRLEPAEGRFRVLLGERVLEEELRSPEVTAGASPLSALPAVRAWLLDSQRNAGEEGGLVADGRDMGSVVFPEAEVKVYLIAELSERARRRFLQREGRDPSSLELQGESDAIRERDERDSRRALAPLRKPEDAVEVDTSHLTFEAQVEMITGLVTKRASRRRGSCGDTAS
jgi:3-phosphoshikimate 1-carboxyvinyltransferase